MLKKLRLWPNPSCDLSLQPVETTTLADGSTTIAHKCQICLKIFGRRSHLVRHMKNLHSAEPPPPMSVLATLAQEPQPPTVQLIHNTPPSRKISTNGNSRYLLLCYLLIIMHANRKSIYLLSLAPPMLRVLWKLPVAFLKCWILAIFSLDNAF